MPEILPCGLNRNDSDIGIYIGIHKITPYKTTLRLIPRIVTLGIGCRRGVTREAISAAVRSALEGANIDPRALERVASIDKKSDELLKVEDEFSESEFVRSTVGVGNVCERSAVCCIASHCGKTLETESQDVSMNTGRLVIHKTARDGVTVAAAVCDWRIEF